MKISRSVPLAALAISPLLFLFAGSSPTSRGQNQPGAPVVEQGAKRQALTEFECRWAEKPIVIDGKGTDPAWQHAQAIDNFYLPWLGKDARPSKTKTRAKLLWDREYLYFFADMEDSDLYANTREHDGMLWNGDVFELFFKPSESHAGYYEFQVNPAGAVLDMFLPRRGAGGYERFIGDGDFNLKAKVHLRGTLNKWTDKDDGWSVEGKIPWTDFLRTGGRPERDEKWKFALCRYDYSVDFEGPELSTCAPLKSKNVADFHAFEDYATLQFLGPEKSPPALAGRLEKRIPLTTSTVVGSPDPPRPYQTERVYKDVPTSWPVIPHMIPGSDEMLVIALNASYGTTRIHRMKDDPKSKMWEPWLISPHTAYQMEFHPKFAENGYVYIGSNGRGPLLQPAEGKHSMKTRITRFTMQTKPPHEIVPGSEITIIDWDSDGHNGGAMVFGHDGMLYVTTGDGTSDSDKNLTGQDMTNLCGKVLRIDVDHPEPAREPGGADPKKNYSVPKDNPFVDLKDARPEIWALGLRNPWRICVDKKTGHLWTGNNGQDLWEQAYLIKKGENYGWSVMEGSHPFYPDRDAGPGPFIKPTVEHHHSEARSLTGGLVYYGKKYPDLTGAYIYGDYSTGKIWAVKHDGTKILWHKEIADTRLTITGFGIDRQGEILIADFIKDGGLYTLVPTPPTVKSTFPRKLSESGLFKSVKGHVMEPALIPYSVNSVLWSDGAGKQRWLGLPANERIGYTNSRGWNFPDKTVIVKSFYIEAEEGKPESRRWIETRFLTKQGSEWHGYSYSWNDAQDEGALIEAKGTDREFSIKVPVSQEYPRGVKKLNWHYPSRAECMVCHSRAANWVLGFTELQMNKEHEYDCVPSFLPKGAKGPVTVRENQLVVFERLGLFKVDWVNEVREAQRKELKAKGKKDPYIDAFLERQSATRGQRTPVKSTLLSLPPEKSPRLVDPYDAKQDLNLRVRSYLHSNCAQCHVKEGGGNAQMEMEFTQPLDMMRIISVKPQHDSFGLQDAKLIVPGFPDRSVLLHRIAQRDKGHMPPLATRLVDDKAVEMMRAWIGGLKKE